MPRSRSFPAALACALTAILLTLGAAPATAHAGLTSSNPEEGATLDELPREIVLEFTEEITTPAFVVVTDPDGQALQSGEPIIDGATVRQKVDPATLAGLHTVAYRVLSADGHPVQGHVRVTVELEADPTPSSETDAAETPATDAGTGAAAAEPDTENTSGTSRAPLIAGGVVVLLVALLGGVLALAKRGRR